MATIEKRGDAYRIIVSAGYDMAGRQIRRRKIWTPAPNMTERQIAKELQRQAVLFEERVMSGQVLDGSIRFAEFIDYWMEEYAEKQLRPKTVNGYRILLTRIKASLGNITLDRLQPRHLMEFYNELSGSGERQDDLYRAKRNLRPLLKERGLTFQALADVSGLSVNTVSVAVRCDNVAARTAQKICEALHIPLRELFEVVERARALSGNTVLHYHRVLSSILEKAVKWQVIFANPCRRVEAPRAERKEAAYLDENQAQQLLTCLQDEPLKYRAIVTTLLYTGMRRGELCGLEWSDIDFEHSLIDISRSSIYVPSRGVFDDETKTQSSKRVIKVPAEAMDLLRKLKAEQLETRLLIGDRWVDSGKVFIQWDGKPIYPDTLTKWFGDFVARHDLPKIHLHSLRHTNATLLIAGGADLRTVSKRLGHSNMTTTSNIYTHAIQSADERAADLLGDILHPVKRA